jgi:hypothetical protein
MCSPWIAAERPKSQAIADALNGIETLRAEVAEWQNRQAPDGVVAIRA